MEYTGFRYIQFDLITSFILQTHHQFKVYNIFFNMATPSQQPDQVPVDGPIESIYKMAKTYLPQLPENTILSCVDNKLTSAIGTCDKLVLSTSSTIKKTVQRIPSTDQVKTYITESSQKTLQRVEEFLDGAIQTLGGQLEEVKENSKETIDRLLTILGKTIEVNSLLVRSTANQVYQYAQSPTTLITDSRVWASRLYIQVSAISIAVREILADTVKQFLGGLGATYTETKNKVKVLLTNVNEPQKAFNLLSERLVDVKNVTVKRVEEGIEIIMDREHYVANLKKLANSLLDVLQTITVKADNALETSTTFTRDLYEKAMRSYKVKKVLLSKSQEAITA